MYFSYLLFLSRPCSPDDFSIVDVSFPCENSQHGCRLNSCPQHYMPLCTRIPWRGRGPHPSAWTDTAPCSSWRSGNSMMNTHLMLWRLNKQLVVLWNLVLNWSFQREISSPEQLIYQPSQRETGIWWHSQRYSKWSPQFPVWTCVPGLRHGPPVPARSKQPIH